MDYREQCKKIQKQCKLTDGDMYFIIKTSGAKNYEEVFYELEEMLRNNQIRIGG